MEALFTAEEVWQFFAAPFQKAVEVVGRKLGTDVYLRNAFFTVWFFEDLLSKQQKSGQGKSEQEQQKTTLREITLNFVNFVKNNMTKNLILNGAFASVTFPAITVNHFPIKAVNRIAPYYFPQEIEYSEIELTRGLTVVGSPFWQWLKKFHDTYEVEYKTVLIIHLARLGQVAPFLGDVGTYVPWFPVRLMFLHFAFPGSYGATDFDALNGEVTLERVTLHFSHFENMDLLETAKPILKKAGILRE